MEAKPKIISVIPARGGSKGIPHKNIQNVGGKPLIAWSLEASKNCPLIDRAIVSTDDEEIAAVAREWGGETPFLRPSELAGDSASTEAALQHAVLWLEQHENYHADIVVFLQPTDIFRRQRWMSEAVQALLDDYLSSDMSSEGGSSETQKYNAKDAVDGALKNFMNQNG